MTRAARTAPVATPRGLPLRVLLVLLEYARDEDQTMRLVAHEISRRWAPIQGTCFCLRIGLAGLFRRSIPTYMHGRLTRVGKGDEIANKARRQSSVNGRVKFGTSSGSLAPNKVTKPSCLGSPLMSLN